MAGITCVGSFSGARATTNTPSAKSSESSAATCKPNRVLPTPPGPVSVTSRTSDRLSNRVTAATSFSRPIKGVGWIGRLLGYSCRDGIGGTSKGDKEGVSLGIDLVTMVLLEQAAQQVPAIGQHSGIVLT